MHEIAFVPMILFLIFVAPVWVILHYVTKWRAARGLSAERPLMILSGNDIEHALLQLGALYAGIPYAPISPAYSLISSDHAKLKYIIELVTPGLIYASDGAVARTGGLGRFARMKKIDPAADIADRMSKPSW